MNEQKRADLIAQLTQNPKLKLVDPKRISGQTRYLLTDELIEARDHQGLPRIEDMPVCEGCNEYVIVGREGLIDGKYCAHCARRHTPPAA